MSDFRPVLVRVRNQLHPAPGAFGRVVKRRQRRRRNQRVPAALLSLSVAAASIGLVARAFLVGREPIRAGTSPAPGFPAILPELRATLPVGSEGGGSVIFAEGSVWVTASANDGSGSGYVVRVDPTTSEAVATIPVNAVPVWETGGAGIAAGAGSVWVTGYGELPSGESGEVLQRIDPETNQVAATVFLGNGQGQDVAVGDGAVWVVIGADNGQTSRDVVVRVDPTTNQVVATIPLEQQWAHWILRRTKRYSSSSIGRLGTRTGPASSRSSTSPRTRSWRAPSPTFRGRPGGSRRGKGRSGRTRAATAWCRSTPPPARPWASPFARFSPFRARASQPGRAGSGSWATTPTPPTSDRSR